MDLTSGAMNILPEKMDTGIGQTLDLHKLDGWMGCYCGKDRNFNSPELQCAFCNRWFHQECITCYLGTCVLFMTNYQFSCKNCSPNGQESFSRRQASFTQMCWTAMANLQHQHPDRKMFSKDKEIIPFLDKHWTSLTTMPRRVKMTWHNTIAKTMAKDTDLYSMEEDGTDHLFGLLNRDLSKIGPNYDLLKTALRAPHDMKSGSSSVDVSKRGTKRKATESLSQPVKRKMGDAASSAKLAIHGYPIEHPYNKDGYRYHLAESDPHAPNRAAYDESVEWAGKPIPGYLYRLFLGSHVLLALHDRAPQLKVAEDRLTITGEKGYSMIRATHAVNRGCWYFEVGIEEMPEGSATRLGWSQALGNLQAPCGYDKFSYSWRSRKGTKFHQSRGKTYSEGYEEGDILGFMIELTPKPRDSSKVLPPVYKDKPLVKFKNNLYYEEKDYVQETEKALSPNKNNRITFFKNGDCQGVAYEDVFDGTYFPCASLYKNATVSFEFGPDFKYPPKNTKCRPISDTVLESIVEHQIGDMIYHIENEGSVPDFI